MTNIVWPDLDQRIERLEAAYHTCVICPRQCGTDRHLGAESAYCGLDTRAWVYKALLSKGEEAAISPTFLIDLGGCSLRCLFCSEWHHVVDPRTGGAIPLEPAWLAETISRHKADGARSLSFVGGDPTVSLLAIVRALAGVRLEDRLPLVWNCNGWTSELARDVLRPLVECWLVDLKFSPRCGKRLAATAQVDYTAEVEATLEMAHADALASTTTSSAMPRLIIRHLLMPEHLDCCTLPIIERIARRYPRATLNLMTMYLPFGPALNPLAGSPELQRLNSRPSVEAALGLASNHIEHLLIDGRPVHRETPQTTQVSN